MGRSSAIVVAAAACTTALLVAPAARADIDPTDYYYELRQDGFLVDGNEKYLLELAMLVCELENAGEKTMQIGDYIAQREHLPYVRGYSIAMYADIDICLQLHPRLIP